MTKGIKVLISKLQNIFKKYSNQHLQQQQRHQI